MVGLTVGLLLASGLLTLFANGSMTGQNLQRSSVQIENARYAAELLQDDLRMAGFYGEIDMRAVMVATPDPTTDPDPCSTNPAAAFAAVPLALPAPVRGVGAGETLACLSNRRAGTDALVVRRLDIDPVAPDTVDGNRYHVQYSFCEADAPGIPLVFSRSKSDFTSAGALRNRACNGPNRVRGYVSRVYFIADCHRCGSDTTPTLKRIDLVGDALVETSLVEGIETLRLEYGFDIDSDGSVDAYRTSLDAGPGPTAEWRNVMAVKANFVARSLDHASGSPAGAQTFELGGTGIYTTANDGFVRRAYSSTIRLVNPSGARELQ